MFLCIGIPTTNWQSNANKGGKRHYSVSERGKQDILNLTQRLVKPNSKIYTDENSAYDLAFHYDLWQVNHSKNTVR